MVSVSGAGHFRRIRGPLGPLRATRPVMIEVKAGVTVQPSMADSSSCLRQSATSREVECFLVYQPGKNDAGLQVLRPGVKAVGLPELLRVVG